MPYQIRRAAGRRAAMAFVLMAAIGSLHAHGPTRQKVIEKIVIDSPPAAVWAVIKDFDALAKWHPAVAESPATTANAEGSVRTLKLKGGGALIETLERYNDAGMSYTYRAKDGGALPVTNYTSTLTVTAGADAGKTVVEWRGAFYRGHPNNDPPPDQNDEAAVKAITGVYQAGLANLKQAIEKK